MKTLDGALKAAGWERIPSQVGAIEVAGATTANDAGLFAGITPNASKELQQRLLYTVAVFKEQGLIFAANTVAELKIVDAINFNVGKKPQ